MVLSYLKHNLLYCTNVKSIFSGMSTVAEVLTACHSGMTIFAFSLITNKCIMDYDSHEEATHTEVIEIGKKREPVIKEFVARLIQSFAQLQEENNISDNDY